MKTLYSFIITIIICNTVIAQPIVTDQNFNPVIGETYTYHSFTPASLTPGSSGANVSWNLSSSPAGTAVVLNYVAPSSTPYASSFPGANIAAGMSGAYEYAITSSTSFERAGLWASGTAFPYNDPEKVISYPFTYNDTYTDPWGCVFTYSGYTFTRSGTITCTADGYGTLMLPNGITLTNVLRIHAQETYTDVYIGGTLYYSSDNYYWIKPGTHYFVATMSSTTTAQGTVYGATYLDAVSIGVSENSLQNKINVYPNPASDRINISIPAEMNIDAKVSLINSMGQEAMTSEIDLMDDVYVINTESLAKGVYILKVQSGAAVVTKKVVLEK